MKKNTKIISQILFVLISYVCNGQESLPPPMAADDIPPPPGLGLPIDGDIVILKVMAIVLGLYFIYNSYKKANFKEIKN